MIHKSNRPLVLFFFKESLARSANVIDALETDSLSTGNITFRQSNKLLSMVLISGHFSETSLAINHPTGL